MEEIARLVAGLEIGIQPVAILMSVIGVVVGILVGAAPGLGPTIGMTVMVPVALALSPENAVILLVAIMVGGSFGNSIPSVLVRVPGTPGAVLTAVEGHPFHERGEGDRALLVCLYSSVVGQFFSLLVFIIFVIPLSQIALRLLYPEMFAIVLLGLLAAAGLVNGKIIKGLVAVSIGLFLSSIGTDPITSHIRMTLGIDMLAGGIALIPAVVGLLAFREVFASAERLMKERSLRRYASRANGEDPPDADQQRARVFVGWLSKADRKEVRAPIAWGTLVGTFVGAVPGAGGNVAAFLAYQVVKMTAKGKQKREFGSGSIRGLAGVDSANNAANGGELIPTLGLGIPGAAGLVVVMAVLSAQGLEPGPRLLQTRPELLYGVFGGSLVATALLAVIGYFTIGPAVRLSRMSPVGTLVTTSALVIIGAYSLRWNLFDVWIAFLMGLLGYVLGKYDYSVVAVSLALVLGGMLESSLRRGLIMTHGWQNFFSRPYTVGLLIAAVGIMVLGAVIGREGKPAGEAD